MHILIMRHGEAANSAAEDSLRPLTKQGIVEAEKMGLWLSSRKKTLIKVFVSPYKRAQQSCKSVISVIEKNTMLKEITPETLSFITPSGNAHQVHDYLDGFLQNIGAVVDDNGEDENQAVLFVSHMPFVSYLVAELTGSVNMPIFSTGAIAVIDYDIKKMAGKIVDMVSPEKVNM